MRSQCCRLDEGEACGALLSCSWSFALAARSALVSKQVLARPSSLRDKPVIYLEKMRHMVCQIKEELDHFFQDEGPEFVGVRLCRGQTP